VETLRGVGIPQADAVVAGGATVAQVLGALGLAAEFALPLLVVLGLWTRPAVAGLIPYTVAATLAAHRFWEFAPPAQFGQLMQFMKNVAMIGGMAAVMGAGPGRYALRP
jgi:putative oxidoreductase